MIRAGYDVFGAEVFADAALHPAFVTPSWYGDSIGHYGGDTLVIDTVGIKTGPHGRHVRHTAQ